MHLLTDFLLEIIMTDNEIREHLFELNKLVAALIKNKSNNLKVENINKESIENAASKYQNFLHALQTQSDEDKRQAFQFYTDFSSLFNEQYEYYEKIRLNFLLNIQNKTENDKIRIIAFSSPSKEEEEIAFHQVVIQIAETLSNESLSIDDVKENIAESAFYLAEYYTFQKEFVFAEKYCFLAITHLETIKSTENYFEDLFLYQKSCGLLGALYSKQKKWQAAEIYYQKSVDYSFNRYDEKKNIRYLSYISHFIKLIETHVKLVKFNKQQEHSHRLINILHDLTMIKIANAESDNNKEEITALLFNIMTAYTRMHNFPCSACQKALYRLIIEALNSHCCLTPQYLKELIELKEEVLSPLKFQNTLYKGFKTLVNFLLWGNKYYSKNFFPNDIGQMVLEQLTAISIEVNEFQLLYTQLINSNSIFHGMALEILYLKSTVAELKEENTLLKATINNPQNEKDDKMFVPLKNSHEQNYAEQKTPLSKKQKLERFNKIGNM